MGHGNQPVLVVIVAYGDEGQLAGCLEALGSGLSVVVVDNGCSDRAQQICRAAGTTYVRPEGNIGFAAAVNLAVRGFRDSGRDVLLLNPDARLRRSDLEEMRDEIRDAKDLIAVAPRLADPDGSPQRCLWPMPSPWTALAGVFGISDRVARRRFLSGAVLLLDGEGLDDVGPFDERFFLYAEEADWQLRASRQGWRVAVASRAIATHQSGGTSADPAIRELYFNASAEHFVRKWYGPVGWQIFRAASILAALRRLLMSRDASMRATQRRAIGHYWRGPIRSQGLSPDVKIAHVVCSDSFAGVERYVSLVAPRLAARGCEVTVIGGDQSQMRRASDLVQWRPASMAWSAAGQLARLGRMDIVHAHMTAADLAAVVTKPTHRARIVATLHFASTRGSTRWRGFLRHLESFLDAQIAISQFVAAATHASLVLPNGVEVVDRPDPRRESSVLVMQRFETEKETDVALRSWSMSQLRNHGWRLRIAGRGSQHMYLKGLAVDLGISDSIDWLGFVGDPSVLLSRTSVLLAPAPAEPFGLTVVEAMARATPVIAADGGAHRETVGSEGWLFAPHEPEACTQLLDALLDRDLAAYGDRLRSRQREKFDIETHSDQLVAVYSGLLRT